MSDKKEKFTSARSIRTQLAAAAAHEARDTLLGLPAQQARLHADLCRSHAHLGGALASAGLIDVARRISETEGLDRGRIEAALGGFDAAPSDDPT